MLRVESFLCSSSGSMTIVEFKAEGDFGKALSQLPTNIVVLGEFTHQLKDRLETDGGHAISLTGTFEVARIPSKEE